MGSVGQNAAESLRVAYAQAIHSQYLLAKYQKEFDKDATILPPADHKIKPLDQFSRHQPAGLDPGTPKSICIIGAGAAGLSAAMQLQKAGFKNIDILEASPQAGGRLFTYEFPDTQDGCMHNYCDIGAMRIPDIPRMKPTLDLIRERLGLKSSLVPYYYDLKEKGSAGIPTMWLFKNSRPESKSFGDAMTTLLLKFGFLVQNPVDPKNPKAGDFNVALENFLGGDYDFYSTRSWLMNNTDDNKPRFTYAETVIAELATTGRNGSFDQALLESICDYLDFQQAMGADWYRLEGGMKVLVDAMVKDVTSVQGTTIKYNTPVIALDNDQNEEKMIVTVQGGSPVKYDAVFNSTSMPCLQRMDISGLELPDTILAGIRTLAYDRSAKVAIKFDSAWWRQLLESPGGVSSTDLPISNIVYPSFDIKPDEPAVLLASYSWSQDATRMGALFNNSDYKQGPNKDSAVVTQVLKNIAKMWSKSGMAKPPTYDDLYAAYKDHFAFSWDQDPYTGGAFALFGPGQFREIYPCFKDPQCQGKFMMCGEALSTEHAWIAGALNSSYASVMAWLEGKGSKAEYGQSLLKASPLGGGVGEHPPEFNENFMYWTAKLAEVEVPPPALTSVAA